MSMAKKTADAPPTTHKDPVVDDPVGAARAEVVKLNDQELRLAMLYRQKAGELAGVKAERGDQVLDAADPAGAARNAGQRVSALLEELESFADAARRARERRLAAIPAVLEAEAVAKEWRAGQLDAEAAKLEAESKRLREALQAHDDWTYVPAPPVIPERLVGGQQGGPSLVLGEGGLRTVDDRGPRHDRLRKEAQALRAEAAQGRYKVAHQAGSLEAETLADLLAVVYSDPMRVGPTVDAIVGWSTKAIEAERRRRARLTSTADGYVAVDAPMRLLMEWHAGVIDQAQSRILEPEPVVVEEFHRAAPEKKVAAAPFDPRKPTLQGTTPYDTSATPAEIRREAEVTGESIEEVAKKFGVPVPKELAQAGNSMASPYEIAQVEAR
jgi:hypothetical protein